MDDRTTIAAMALQGLLARYGHDMDESGLIRDAVSIADDLMVKLSEGGSSSRFINESLKIYCEDMDIDPNFARFDVNGRGIPTFVFRAGDGNSYTFVPSSTLESWRCSQLGYEGHADGIKPSYALNVYKKYSQL